MNPLEKMRPLFAFVQMLVIAVGIMETISQAAGQAGTGETVIQKATEQFENSPLKITSLGRGIYIFSGDGGDVTAIVDEGSTLLIDSGLPSRTTELNDAVFKTTMRPVTRLVQVRQRIRDLIAAGKTMDEVVGAAPTKDLDAKWGSGYVTADVFTKMVFSSLAGTSSARR